MSQVLRVKNWTKYQGYQKRGPAWVKLYASLLTDPGWISLPVESRALLPALWLVASGQSTAGDLPADVRILAILTHVSESEVAKGLPPLISFGFIQCDRSVAGVATEVSGEKRREEESREETEESGASAPAPSLSLVEPQPTADERALAKLNGPPSDRERYAREVWDAWIARRGRGGPEMSSAEWHQVCKWFDAGIPLRVTLQGIADCRGSLDPRKPLLYARGAVEAEVTRWQRGRTA